MTSLAGRRGLARGAAAVGAALALMGACAAQAQPTASRSFDLPAQPLQTALVRFALQAGVSLGGSRACLGRSEPVEGRLTAREALDRLLARSGCRAEWVDASAVRIVAIAGPGRPEPPPAPPPSPPPAFTSTEIVVTATKRSSLLDRLPYAISALRGEDLKLSGAVDTADVAAQLAGVTVTNLGPGRDKILLRGLSDGAFTGRTQSTVGLYLDHVPITYNAPDPDLRLADIDTVEVLRGPQGSLYGSGSIAGIYRIVTRQPVLDSFSGSIEVSGATTRAGTASGGFEGMFNLPIVKDRIALRAVGYSESDGGYINDAALGLSDVNRTVRSGVRAAVRIQASPGWTGTLGGTVQWINSSDTQYVNPALGRLTRASAMREPHDNDFAQAYLTLEGRTPWGDLTSSTALVVHDIASRYDASAAASLFRPSAAGPAAFDELTTVRLLVEELNLVSPDGSPLRWLAGAFASASDEATVGDLRLPAASSGPLLYHEARTDRLVETAVYGEVSYDLAAGLSFTAGLRYFHSAVRTASRVTGEAGPDRLFDGRTSVNGWAPKAVLAYRFTPDAQVYALVSEGYRSGGFNTGGPIGQGFSSSGPEPDRLFRPDELWNYELGLKASLLSGRLKLRAAGFYAVWNDLQTDQFLPSGLSFTANAGDGRNLGLEMELVYQPTDRLSFRLNVLADHPELIQANASFPARADVGLPGVPDVSAGAAVSYRRPLASGLALVLDAQATYVGASRLTFDPSLSPRMGDYTLAKASAALVAPRWRLTAVISNPSDSSGDTFAYGNPFSLRTARQVTPLRPLTVGLSLGLTF